MTPPRESIFTTCHRCGSYFQILRPGGCPKCEADRAGEAELDLLREQGKIKPAAGGDA